MPANLLRRLLGRRADTRTRTAVVCPRCLDNYDGTSADDDCPYCGGALKEVEVPARDGGSQ